LIVVFVDEISVGKIQLN